MKSGSGDEPAWEVGEERVIKGKLGLCSRGYHSSPSWYDALSYAQGTMACIVEVSKPTEKQDDKRVSRKCKIIQCVDAQKILRAWACDCAERALIKIKVADERSRNAIKVARLYNEGKATKKELNAAENDANAVRAVLWAERNEAANAERKVERAVETTAAWKTAGNATWSVVWAVETTAAWNAAAWNAAENAVRNAWTAEIQWQKTHLDELMSKEVIN